MGNRRHRVPLLAIGALLASTTVVFADPPTPAAGVTPTIVTIEWHDGNADQIDVLPILQNHGMHATFLVNTGPILAGDPAKLTVGNLDTLFAAGNEIAGHTLDHVNIQPLSTAAARNEVCTDRNNLLSIGSPDSFQPTSLAYPFASFDDASEDVAHYCGYNGASATAGLTLKGPVANTVPPADPYAVRTVPAIKKSTKLATMERFVSGGRVPGADGWKRVDGLRVPPSLRRTRALRALRDLRVEALPVPGLPGRGGRERRRGPDDAAGDRGAGARSVRPGHRHRV